jgi:hypothetical protein
MPAIVKLAKKVSNLSLAAWLLLSKYTVGGIHIGQIPQSSYRLLKIDVQLGQPHKYNQTI